MVSCAERLKDEPFSRGMILKLLALVQSEIVQVDCVHAVQSDGGNKWKLHMCRERFTVSVHSLRLLLRRRGLGKAVGSEERRWLCLCRVKSSASRPLFPEF